MRVNALQHRSLHWLRLLSTVATALMIVAASGICVPKQTLAQKTAVSKVGGKTTAKTGTVDPRVLFMPPPDHKKPRQTVSAGSRLGGSCLRPIPDQPASSSVKQTFRALVPDTNLGLTVSDHPSFWLYVPPTSARRIILSVWEESSTARKQASFAVPASSGILGLSWPQNFPALAVGKTYQWAAVLVCGNQPTPNDLTVLSWISRVAVHPTPLDRPLDQAAAYGRQGVWFDALTVLARARRTQPDQPKFAAAWLSFLQSAGLGTLASEPLIAQS